MWALVPLDLWAPGPLDPWTLGPLWALGSLDPLRPDLDTTLDGPWTLGPLDPDTILDGPWTLGALEPCGPVRFEIDPLVIFGSVWVNLLKLTRNLCKFTMLVAFGPLNPWTPVWAFGPLDHCTPRPLWTLGPLDPWDPGGPLWTLGPWAGPRTPVDPWTWL